MKLYAVKYSGIFGFISPAAAVRDDETQSQQFLTPSIVEGMEKKLFLEQLSVSGIEKIIGHRLAFTNMSPQQEATQSAGVEYKKEIFGYKRATGIITRHILINPRLWLLFQNLKDAKVAFSQTICLCRNEDILSPKEIVETTQEEFNTNSDLFNGFELCFDKSELYVGVNRYSKKGMFGSLIKIGNPNII